MLETLRKAMVTSLLDVKSVSQCWPSWRLQLLGRIGDPPSVNSVLQLGDHLSEVFKSTGTEGRAQGELSGAGTAWESLIAWYLNLVTVGTRTIVFRKASDVPRPVRDALTVKFGPNKTNTESDLVAITLPSSGYPDNVPDRPDLTPDQLIDFCEEHFRALKIAVIQCKTNWNDNAQIPMLWDMIYSAKDFPGRSIVVGDNAFALQRAASFRYAFATVPSNDKDKIQPHSLAVQRVSGLSGGNYWGHPSKNRVCQSLKEIFAGAAIGPDRGQGIRQSLDAVLRRGGVPDYFRLQTGPVTLL